MHPLIVIPARFGSTRIPGKPLSKINGEPLIAAVVRRVLSFELDAKVVVATDDERVESAVAPTEIETVRTSSQHKSGTERAAEVVGLPEFSQFDPILNIQGDQLFLPKNAAVGALDELERGFALGTSAAPLQPNQETDRNRVKVAVDNSRKAALFSREMPSESGQAGTFLHLGVYSYTREALLEWVSLPPTEAEFDQGLEQLRPFLHGISIGVAVLGEPAEAGIDTRQDIDRAHQLMALTRTNA